MRRANARSRKRSVWPLRLAMLGVLPLAMLAVLAQTAMATTYVITDGDRVMTYTTFATDPGEVLDQAGLTLSALDTYTTEAVDGGEAITIRRAQSVSVIYHGQGMQTTSMGETAGELLSRLNLDVSGEDVLSHDLDSATYDGMELRVDRVVTVRETYTAATPHAVTYCADATLPEGAQQVLVAGVDEELLCTADVTYVNGIETERLVLSQSVTRAAVTEVVGVGSGEAVQADADAMPVIADGYIYLPTGEVLTYTRSDTIRATAYTHTDAGCDMITATGTTVHQGTVAVDPRYIPYGTRMFIVSNDGAYVLGICVAEDCGGDIKTDRMDVYFPTYDECIEFGRRKCTIYFLG